MSLFNDTLPPNTEAVRNGASRIREMKTTLNAALGQLFNDDTSLKSAIWGTASIQDGAITTAKLLDHCVTTVKLAIGALSVDAPGHAVMADGYLCSDPGTFAGALIIGNTYRIDALAGGDVFTNVGYVSDGIPFVATGTAPTTWTNGTIVNDVASGAYGFKTSALTSGRTYRIDALVSPDDFTNVGYVSLHTVFTATGTTPNVWAHGTIIVDTVLEEGLAKLADGVLVANSAGRAKMENGYITSSKLGSGAVTTDKLADSAVTLVKLDPSARGAIGWACIKGPGLRGNRLLTTTISATTAPTVTAHGLFTMSSGNHELGAIPTSVDDVIAVVINRNEDSSYLTGSGENHVYTPGPVFPGTSLLAGAVYFARPVNSSGTLSSNQFTLHATPQDVVNGVNVIDFGGSISSGTPYIQYFRLADRTVKNCAVFPLALAGQEGEYLGAIVAWLTPPSSAHYQALFNNNDPAQLSAFRIMGQDANYVIFGPNGATVGNGNWGSAYPSMRLTGLN